MKTLTLLVALLACIWTATAQNQTKPVVSNLQVDSDGKRLKVTYTLQGTVPADSIYLRVESRTRGVLSMKPEYVTGDVGRGVEPGPNKVIYWDYALEGVQLDEIRATVNVKPASLKKQDESATAGRKKPSTQPQVSTSIGGGPHYALLSALLPGIGNIFVQPNRKVGFRPVVTGAYLGLLVYGISQRGQSNKQYDLYNAQLNETDAQPYYDAANQYHQRYYLATRAAAVLMLTDVTFTLLKGLRNQKLRRTQGNTGVSLHYLGTTPTLAFRHTF